jgi:site-specific recombinase XerC
MVALRRRGDGSQYNWKGGVVMAVRLSGSMTAQAHFLMYKVGFKPGTSRSMEKAQARATLEAQGKSVTSTEIAQITCVPSDDTARSYATTWKQLGEFAREDGGRTMAGLTGQIVERYIESKIDKGDDRSSLERELSAINKLAATLEKALDGRSFDDMRKGVENMRPDVAECPENKLADRAYADPRGIVNALDGLVGLVGRYIQESGCRIAEGCCIQSHQLKGIGIDKYTGKEVGRVEVTGKGGNRYTVSPSVGTYRAIEKELAANGRIDVNQQHLRGAVKAVAGNEYVQRGVHGFRYNFAQQRIAELQHHGISRDVAKAITSEEMGHHRVQITEVYLAGK